MTDDEYKRGDRNNRNGGYKNRDGKSYGGDGHKKYGDKSRYDGGYKNRDGKSYGGDGYKKYGDKSRNDGGYKNRDGKSYGGDGYKKYGDKSRNDGGYKNRDGKSYGGDGYKKYGDKSRNDGGYKNREGKSYGGDGYKKYGDKNYAGKRDRGDNNIRTEEAEKEPAQPTTKVKLRLDVKDVVRPRGENAESGATSIGDGEFKPKILFEDNHLLVVVKPQNMPTQGDESGDPDLLSLLKEYLIKTYDKPGDAYLGLLHRLDRPTGGVMVFAKTSKAASRLSEQIRSGDLEKTYAAVTVGRPNRTGHIEHYLLKDEKTNTVSLAPSTLDGVKRAVSDVGIVQEKDGLSLVSVKLLTGRTHQARVQLKALGSPIAGDSKYGGDKYVSAPHLALWAYRLCFAHPVSGEPMTFLCEPPDESPWNNFNTAVLVDVDRPVEHGYNIK